MQKTNILARFAVNSNILWLMLCKVDLSFIQAVFVFFLIHSSSNSSQIKGLGGSAVLATQ